jgi:hypothetical protein
MDIYERMLNLDCRHRCSVRTFVLHMLLLHRTMVNGFKGTVNLKHLISWTVDGILAHRF